MASRLCFSPVSCNSVGLMETTFKTMMWSLKAFKGFSVTPMKPLIEPWVARCGLHWRSITVLLDSHSQHVKLPTASWNAYELSMMKRRSSEGESVCVHVCVTLYYYGHTSAFNSERTVTRFLHNCRQRDRGGWKWMKSDRVRVREGECWTNRRHQIALCSCECVQTRVPSGHCFLPIKTVHVSAMHSCNLLVQFQFLNLKLTIKR